MASTLVKTCADAILPKGHGSSIEKFNGGRLNAKYAALRNATSPTPRQSNPQTLVCPLRDFIGNLILPCFRHYLYITGFSVKSVRFSQADCGQAIFVVNAVFSPTKLNVHLEADRRTLQADHQCSHSLRQSAAA
jgi:hypothetical protein